jgi:hypothetical protein
VSVIVSRLPDASWVLGEHPDAVWTYSTNGSKPIAAAKTAYYKLKGKQPRRLWPTIEPGLYVVPDELVPIGRVAARLMGTRFYVGKACPHHPLNHIRSVGNKACAVCEILRQVI